MSKHPILLAITLCIVSSTAYAAFDSGRSEISISVNNEIYPYKEFAIYVLPSEHLGICLLADNPDQYLVQAEDGDLDYIDDCRWIWTAPVQPGLTQLSVSADNDVKMSINVFVMTPGSELSNGRINDTEIGDYPEPLEDSPIYLPPDGFIRVTAELIDTPVSPNFVLGQFISPLDDNFPKYVVLRERLLLKLEALLERLNETGVEAESLAIIAGYLTPAYNESIGGLIRSRHIYGGAATVIVDKDGDGRMDDLDGNGRVDNRDGVFLFNIIDELYSEAGKEYLRGGLYLYNDSNNAAPSVRLDARGFRKRWPNESEIPPLPENLRPKHKRQLQ